MWYKFCKKYDTAIAALWFDKKDIDKIKLDCNWDKFKEKTADGEFHVTLMYLGKISDIKSKKKSISDIAESICDKYKGLELTVGGVAKFFSGELNPIVLTINSNEIETLRLDFINSMNALGIEEPSDSPGFIPHLTLGYTNNNINIDIENNLIKPKYLAISWGGDLIKYRLN